MNTIVLATFSQPGAGKAAVADFLDAGFINVEQEQDGDDMLVTVDAGDRAAEARGIVARHGGVEIDQPWTSRRGHHKPVPRLGARAFCSRCAVRLGFSQSATVGGGGAGRVAVGESIAMPTRSELLDLHLRDNTLSVWASADGLAFISDAQWPERLRHAYCADLERAMGRALVDALITALERPGKGSPVDGTIELCGPAIPVLDATGTS